MSSLLSRVIPHALVSLFEKETYQKIDECRGDYSEDKAVQYRCEAFKSGIKRDVYALAKGKSHPLQFSEAALAASYEAAARVQAIAERNKLDSMSWSYNGEISKPNGSRFKCIELALVERKALIAALKSLKIALDDSSDTRVVLNDASIDIITVNGGSDFWLTDKSFEGRSAGSALLKELSLTLGKAENNIYQGAGQFLNGLDALLNCEESANS